MSALYRTLTGQSQKSHTSEQSKRPVSTLTRTTTTDPFSGALNHLTEAQAQKLEQFRARLEKEGWWKREGINGKPSHDDGTLLRYLRARKFDVAGAYGQFTDTEKWYKENRIEELYDHFDVDFYERARLMYPQWTGHRDRRGIPIYVYVIKGLDSKNVAKYAKESEAYKSKLPNHKNLKTPAKLLPLFALYHNLLNFVLPMVSTLERPNPEVPVTNSTNIVDISGVGLTQFWNLKAHMQDASVLATAHYPETLDRIFIIGAPSFFPTVWGWIKRWFDPVTVSKIFILSKAEVKPTLEKFMDPKDFPKHYGGNLDWEWGQLPHIDQETREALETDGKPGWVRGPALWLEHKRVVVGSEHGKPRKSDKEIEEMKPVVYAADWTAEPVHPERRASSGSHEKEKIAPPNVPPLEKRPSEHAISAAKKASEGVPPAAVVGGGVAGAAAAEEAVTAATHANNKVEPPKPQNNVRAENIKTAPSGDPVNMVPPQEQAAFPEQTAEYLKKDKVEPMQNGTVDVKPTNTDTKDHASQLPAASTHTVSKPLPNGTSGTATPPPGIPAPGPTPQHTVEVTKAVAHKLEGESVSTIPADANGSLPHPNVVVATDKSKGLAIEEEKLEAVEGERPAMQRFVTAAEF